MSRGREPFKAPYLPNQLNSLLTFEIRHHVESVVFDPITVSIKINAIEFLNELVELQDIEITIITFSRLTRILTSCQHLADLKN